MLVSTLLSYIFLFVSFNSLVDCPPPYPRSFTDLIKLASLKVLGSSGGTVVVVSRDNNGFPTSLAVRSDQTTQISFDSIFPPFLDMACHQEFTTQTPTSPPTTSPSTTTNKTPGTAKPDIPDETDLVCFTRKQAQAIAGSGVFSFLLNVLGFLISFLLGCKFKAVISPSTIKLEVERDTSRPPTWLFRQLSFLLSLRSTTVFEDPIDLVNLNSPPAPDQAAIDPTPINPVFDLPNGPSSPIPPRPASPPQQPVQPNLNPTNPFFFHNHL